MYTAKFGTVLMGSNQFDLIFKCVLIHQISFKKNPIEILNCHIRKN